MLRPLPRLRAGKRGEILIYFDNAATGGRKPDSVIEAVKASIEGICGNPGRSGHALSVNLAQRIYECRKLLCSFFGSEDPERVILTKNCTEALCCAIFGMVRGAKNAATYSKKPHIITTAAEHNSVLRPLFFLQREGEIELTIVQPVCGRVAPEAIAAEVRPNTLAAVFTLASNVNGEGIDPARVRALLPERVYTVCDGAQACGHIPIDMKGAGIDALAAAGHKGLHGIQGSGALLFSERLALAPLLYGGTGSESALPDMPAFYPDRPEAGTLSCPAAASLTEGVLYLTTRLQSIGPQLTQMTDVLLKGLQEIADIRVYSRPNPFGIVAFSCEKISSELFAQALSDGYGIAVRGGLHCAPLMHRALGTFDVGLVRASLSEFNTEKEIQTFLSAVREIACG